MDHRLGGKKRWREETLFAQREQEQVPLTRQISIKSVSRYPKVSFILDNAAIKKAFIKKKWVVANCYDDEAALRRQNKDPQDYRSEIVHEIANGVLFEVKPHVRIPRTLPRFNGLMCISNSSHKLVDVNCYINAASDDMHLVFVEHLRAKKLTRNISMISFQLQITHSNPKLALILSAVHLNENGRSSNFIFEIL
ncbi:UNVERIFIED_CONTAM: hypothetical protein Sangu_1992400 [Sesamum angustifolium]|uniref:Uncharacterized protein n=1 Tax=Sesamum angustifolium TaxID=2727405 RepID=A0AAW2LG79_9LAMI